MLRPEDIEQKTFSTALRGYDLNEVDDFLDEIMATIRDLTEQLDAARAGQPAAEPAPAAATDPVAAPAVDESAVGRALVAAQEAADRIVAEANAEAERIKEGAREEADSWTSEREEARIAAQKEMADLSSRVDSVRRELAFLATGVADSLDRMDAVIAESEPGAEDPATEWDEPTPRHAAVAGVGEDESSWDDEADSAEEGDDGDSGGSPDEPGASFDSDDSPDEDSPDDLADQGSDDGGEESDGEGPRF